MHPFTPVEVLAHLALACALSACFFPTLTWILKRGGRSREIRAQDLSFYSFVLAPFMLIAGADLLPCDGLNDKALALTLLGALVLSLVLSLVVAYVAPALRKK